MQLCLPSSKKKEEKKTTTATSRQHATAWLLSHVICPLPQQVCVRRNHCCNITSRGLCNPCPPMVAQSPSPSCCCASFLNKDGRDHSQQASAVPDTPLSMLQPATHCTAQSSPPPFQPIPSQAASRLSHTHRRLLHTSHIAHCTCSKRCSFRRCRGMHALTAAVVLWVSNESTFERRRVAQVLQSS